MEPGTIGELLSASCAVDPGRTAIVDVDGGLIPYATLIGTVGGVAAAVVAAGVAPEQAVAIVLENGPAVAMLFLGVACAAVAAPLNLSYTEAELAFFYEDLAVAALVTDGCSAAAIELAERRGIPVLRGPFAEAPLSFTRAPDDVALVLHTSGTTARPKQVPLTHANLCTSASNVAATLQLAPNDRCLNVMPLFHIHGLVAALLSSLRVGASVVCTPGLDATRFLHLAATLDATWYTAVPTMHQAVLAAARRDAAGAAAAGFRFIRSSSAALPPTVLHGLEDVFGAPVVEAYGMTEASHQMASNPLPPGTRKPGTVGMAAGSGIAIMGIDGELLPVGATGEIVIKGPAVTRGYVGNAEANAAAFAHGWFHTGDQGALDDDGYLTITGRLKELINRGGEKISPREIDEVLLDHPSVARAVAFAVPHPTLGEDVAAAVVGNGPHLDTEELRRFAGQRLAPFKVPGRIVVLDELPVGATGKVQRVGMAERLGLLQPAPTLRPAARDLGAQPLEAAVARVWAHLLELDHVGRDARFLDLGGDSLSAIALVAEIAEVFDVDLPLTAPLDAGATVAQMAALIEGEHTRGGPRAPVDDGAPAAIAHAQERLWVLHQLDPDSSAYSVPMGLLLHGPLDRVALRAALSEIVARHDVLRSVFPEHDGVPQLIVAPAVPFELPDVDVSSENDPLDAAVTLASALAAQPFDLASGPVVRGALYRLGSGDHLLAIVFHHIATDAWSRRVFRDELAVLYPAFISGQPSPLPALALQYPVLTATHRRQVETGAFEADEVYWRQRLETLPPPVSLPTDHPRPRRWSSRGAVVAVSIPPTLRSALTAFAVEQHVTPFMVLLAGFGELLSHHSQSDDLIIGIPVAGRVDPRSTKLIGPFVNTLPIRLDLSGRPSFVALVEQVRQTCLAAYEHQALPFERMVDGARAPRALDHAPVVQVMFQLRALLDDGREIGGVTTHDVELTTGGAKLDLSVDVTDHGDAMTVRFEYPSALFDAATVTNIGRRFVALLASACSRPSEPVGASALLDDVERAQLERLATEGSAVDGAWTVPARVASIAAARPSSVALQCGDVALTFGELQARVDALARHLRAMGAHPGSTIGVCLERGIDLPVALLAALHAGGAFVPLDPTFPAARLSAIAAEAGADVLVTTEALVDRGPDAAVVVCLDRDAAAIERAAGDLPAVEASSLAYVVATSGSTGRPKAVAIEHGSFASFLAGFAERLGLDDDTVFLASTPTSFDPSLRELLLPLVLGGRVVVAPATIAESPHGVRELIEREHPTLVQGTPTTLRLLLDTGWCPDASVTLLSCGEPLPSTVSQQLSTAAAVWNLYGPTETTQCAVVHHVDDSPGLIPVGRPLPGVIVEVVGDDGERVPIGLPGEIVLAGAGVAGGRRYHTGDVGRWRGDGTLECLGRNDDQLKLNGVRVEPGDIQAALLDHPEVRSAIAGVRGGRLVAWVAVEPRVSEADLRRWLSDRLPHTMVPDAIVTLATLPLLPSGKVDRAALPDAVFTSGSASAAPAGYLEERLAAVWSAVLDHPVVIGRDDDFFALGGSSLLAIELMLRVERIFGRQMPLTQLYTTPTLAGMAAAIEEAPSSATGAPDSRLGNALVPVRRGKSSRPLLLWVPGVGGTTLALQSFAEALPDGIELMGFEAAPHRGLPAPVSYAAMATAYADDVRGLVRAGVIGVDRPFVLGGQSYGAALALEIARLLAEDDGAPGRVVLVDPRLVPLASRRSVRRQVRRALGRVARRSRGGERVADSTPAPVEEVMRMHHRLGAAHRHQLYAGSVVLITSEQRRRQTGDPLLHIRPFVGGDIDAHALPGTHKMLLVERVGDVAAIVAGVVDELDGATRQTNAEGNGSSSASSSNSR